MFSETWYLLQQEGYLTQSCLCNGLTALRHANIGDKKGLYYSAFFELSIGFERLMKLIIVIDHMAKHELSPPTSAEVERYKHRLTELLAAINGICATRNLTFLNYLDRDSIQVKLIDFLDSYAHPGGRYANINKLTGSRLKVHADPLMVWNEIADLILDTRATPQQRRGAEVAGQIAEEWFGDMACNLISDLARRAQDLQGLFKRMSELDTAAKLAVHELVVLISALVEVLTAVTTSARAVNRSTPGGVAHIPDMREFFQFAWPDKKVVLRKKRWP